jgi:EpsI family protein
MTGRRKFLMGAGCVAAGGLAYALKPRRRVTLLGDAKMEDVVPVSFPGWSAEAAENLVKPELDGLAASLYNEVVQRTYRGDLEPADVMLLVAYGGTQSDMLQLHRPEVCYPALGFTIKSKVDAVTPLPGGTELPVVRLVAVAGDRIENIVYWTRLGEALPRDNKQQRSILLKNAMEGFVPDGVLVRQSVINPDSEAAFRLLDGFIPKMVAAVKAGERRALVGTSRASAMKAALT